MDRTTLLLLLGYCLFLCTLDALPFPDLPNHLTRSCMVGSLIYDNPSPFSAIGKLSPQFTSYILGDILMGTTCEVMGYYWTGILWNVLAFISIPIGMKLIVQKQPANVQNVVILFSIFLSTGQFFLMGFLFYQIAIGLSLATVAAFDHWTEEKSVRSFLIYSLWGSLCFLTHLAPFVVLAPILSAKCIVKLQKNKLTIRQVALAAMPLLTLFALQFRAWSRMPASQMTTPEYRYLSDKVLNFFQPLFHFHPTIDLFLVALLAVSVLASVYISRKGLLFSLLRTSSQQEYFICTLLLTIVYLLLPVGGWRLYFIDSRLLSFILCLGLILLCRIIKNFHFIRHALVFVASLNLLILYQDLTPKNQDAREMQLLLKSLPSEMTLFPVNTQPNNILEQHLRHTPCLYSLFKFGRTPYLLRGGNGDPMVMFEYINPLPPTDENWYPANIAGPDWNQVRDLYELLVITKPFDSSRIDLTGYDPIVENRVAIAFKRSHL